MEQFHWLMWAWQWCQLLAAGTVELPNKETPTISLSKIRPHPIRDVYDKCNPKPNHKDGITSKKIGYSITFSLYVRNSNTPLLMDTLLTSSNQVMHWMCHRDPFNHHCSLPALCLTWATLLESPAAKPKRESCLHGPKIHCQHTSWTKVSTL